MDITGWGWHASGRGGVARSFEVYDERDGLPYARYFQILCPYTPSVLHMHRIPGYAYGNLLRIPVSKTPDIRFREIHIGQGHLGIRHMVEGLEDWFVKR
jgi:hypothetical protein